MSDDPRVQRLLAELLDSDTTPEEACRSCPGLLPRVRARWRQMCRARDELDVLFPPRLRPGASTPPPAEEAGSLPNVPGYEIEGLLGRGGMGIVFRARHVRLNRVVALKMALGGAYAGPTERLRFQREAEAVARLRHPNIVQVYDVGDSDGRPYFTMEFVEGGSLARQAAGAPLPPREAAALLATLAGAVHAAHAGGIIHRDLKPANVLLTSDGEPKIGDFGLAWRLDDAAGLTNTGVALGTPSYMAPEQAGGKRITTEAAVDIYALGAILYELLTGRPPFRAATAADTIQQVIGHDPVAPSRLNAKVPRDLETVCLKCLQKEPRVRYATAAALKDDLDRFLQGEAILARPEGRLGRLARRVKRRPAMTATLAGGLLVLLAMLGIGAWLVSERATVARRIAADEAAADRAADEALREAVERMSRAKWADARVALDRATARRRDASPPNIRNRLEQGESDLALVERVDAIRLTSYTRVGGVIDFTPADREYEDAFRRNGFDPVGGSPDIAATRVRSSDIRIVLLAALDSWSFCTKDPERRRWVLEVTRLADDGAAGWRARARDPDVWKDDAALVRVIDTAHSLPLLVEVARHSGAPYSVQSRFLKRVHRRHADDFWVNLRLGDVLFLMGAPGEAVGYYQAAVAIRPTVAIVRNNLGIALERSGRAVEANESFLQAIELDPGARLSHLNLAVGLWNVGRKDEALARFRESIRQLPDFAALYVGYGKCLGIEGKYDESLALYRSAVSLEPKSNEYQRELRATLIHLGRADEACAAWAKALEAAPTDHEAWYGYSELCLFLGRDEEYERSRRALLAAFGSTTDPFIAERTSRACLLRPETGDEMRRTVVLAERAASTPRTKYPVVYHAFLFVKGLAEYRLGKYELAIATMNGEASKALGPTPRLIVAMAQHQSGRAVEARKTLAAAISSHDWRPSLIRDQDGWICHVIRREAERLILPNLDALLDGREQPSDNAERLSLLGVYQFANRFRDSARMYEAAFSADPKLVDDLTARHRDNAARIAALAGCGTTASDTPESERSQLRAKARQWMREELAACGKALDGNLAKHRDRVRDGLMRWKQTPDLAGLREQADLEKLPPDERKDCHKFWEEVGVVLKRAEGVK